MYRTYLDLCQRLVEEAGVSGTITSVENQSGEFKRVVEWIKRATFEIEGSWLDWNFLHTFSTINLIVNVRDYPAPADHNRWDTSTAQIKAESLQLDYIQWVHQKVDPTPAVAGDPYRFTVLPSQTLRFMDTPTREAVVSIEYWKKPTELESNTDQPAIPEQYRDVIVWKALQYYANYESADEVKTQAIENYNDRINQLQSRELPGYQGTATMYTGSQIDVIAQASEPFNYDGY